MSRVDEIEHENILSDKYHWCPSCKVRVVGNEYRRCVACQRKWGYVYESCRKAGWPGDLAICKANQSYPES
jgi:hypothetical protein